ncbi:hypothetical protein BH20ACI4_BH20ACI4_23120 [soil metagenome]
MKVKIKIGLFSIILILMICAINSSELIAQDSRAMAENSENEVSNNEVVLEAKLSAEEFQADSPVELFLIVKNNTKSTVVLFDPDPFRGFDITIKDADGMVLPLTEEGKKRKYPNIIMGRESVYLTPGENFKLPGLRLERLFDLKKDGNYTLEVKRPYYFQEISQEIDLQSEVKTLAAATEFSIKQ